MSTARATMLLSQSVGWFLKLQAGSVAVAASKRQVEESWHPFSNRHSILDGTYSFVKMATDTLNKNRMMVFKNKGKDQEVSLFVNHRRQLESRDFGLPVGLGRALFSPTVQSFSSPLLCEHAARFRLNIFHFHRCPPTAILFIIFPTFPTYSGCWFNIFHGPTSSGFKQSLWVLVGHEITYHAAQQPRLQRSIQNVAPFFGTSQHQRSILFLLAWQTKSFSFSQAPEKIAP